MVEFSREEAAEYAQVRCLFCLAGHENAVCRAVQTAELGRPIVPLKVKRIRRANGWEERKVPMLPGYVFVYQDENQGEDGLRGLEHVVRLLRYSQDGDSLLAGSDRRFADWLWQQDGVVGVLKAIKVGERVEIVDGLFREFKGRVVSMDRRKQAARVELDVLGSARYIWLSFDYLKQQRDGANAGE